MIYSPLNNNTSQNHPRYLVFISLTQLLSRSEIDFDHHASINTYILGVCTTYIENELMLLYISIQKQKVEKGNRKYSDSEILDWLNKRISQAHEQSYRGF
jgi:hypothetical protein